LDFAIIVFLVFYGRLFFAPGMSRSLGVAVADEEHVQRRLIGMGRCTTWDKQQAGKEEQPAMKNHAEILCPIQSRLL
jgi:hypothetical protein